MKSIVKRAGTTVEVRIVRHAPAGALRAVRRRAAKAGIDKVIVPGSQLSWDEHEDALTLDSRDQ
jgi:hypothetical protein